MRSVFVLAAVAVLGAGATPAAAQDQDQGKDGPAVELRLKSVNDLLDYLEYVGRVVNQDEQAKQLVGLVKAFSTAKGLEGVDTKRPFGMYASVTPNVVDSPVVVMIPVADEEAVLNLLRTRLSLGPKKGDDGVYELKVPNVPAAVYFRYAKDYAFITARDKKPLAEKKLVDPKAFFAGQDSAVLSVTVHIDRVPAEVRTAVFGQFELQLNQEKARKNPGDTPARHQLKGLILDAVAGAAHTVLTGGKTLSARFVVAPKDDEFALDVTLTGTDGSDLGKALKKVAGRKGVAPTAAKVPAAVFAAAANLGLPPTIVDRLGPVVDDLIKEAIESAKPDDRVGVEKVLDALRPTLKAGQVEAGVALTGSRDAGGYRLVAAARTKDGTGIETVAKEIAPHVPEDKAKIEFDTARVGGKALHKLTVPDPDVKKYFGTDAVWAITGDDLFVLSFEPDAAEAKRVATGTPAAGDVFRIEVAAAAAAFAFENQLPKPALKQLVDETFDSKPTHGRDTVKLTATGGDKLTVTFMAKGRAIKLLAAMDQTKKKGS